MTAYNSVDFEPPAPIALVTLIADTTGKNLPGITMQLDTGADVTLIPQAAIRQLGLGPSETQYELIGFDGTRSMAGAVQLKMKFGRYTFRGTYLLTEQPIGVIGRDVLNLVAILFDGPHLVWSEYRAV